jgi:4-hydroxy 2-oxovalerate aldolase
MNPITVLDVSLRDGGHRTNFHFKDSQLQGILEPLDKAGLDYIEIGYRNGSLHPIENLGRAGFCHKDYLIFCHSLIKSAKMAVMVHPKNVSNTELLELKNCGVQLIRICVEKGGLEGALPVLQQARALDLAVSVNFIHLSYYNEIELDAVVEKVSQYQPSVVYFADSNGSLLPMKISKIYKKYINRYSFPFGFHAHDNLGLAQANTLAALDAGVHFIDASLGGMGKGTGNLKTEFFLAYLQAIQIEKYHLQHALTAANYVRSTLNIGSEALEMDEFIRGISDFSTADLKKFKKTNTDL